MSILKISVELMTGISTAEPEKTTLYIQWKHLKFTSVFLTQLFLKVQDLFNYYFNTWSSFMTLPFMILQYSSTRKINFVFLEKVAKLK